MLIEDKYILKDSNPFNIHLNEEATINLELEKSTTYHNTILKGKVFDRNSPISNATVSVFDRHLNPLAHTTTNENGIYSFTNLLSPGEYKVIASAKYYATSLTKYVVIRPNDISELSFSLKTSSALVNGLVYGKVMREGTNIVIPDVKISIKSSDDSKSNIYETTSNNNGQYIIYDILPYEYILEASKPGYIFPIPIKFTVNKFNLIPQNINLILDTNNSSGMISGTILYNRVPVSNTVVFLYQLDDIGNEVIVQVQVTNKYGIYLFSDVEKGSYMVKCKLQSGEDYKRSITI
ncbi:carboxypeptidase-like regulatory domain-containing protein [Clostridium sp. SHJSY1]|uniref:carboxypeptidase-like regulatory domain-containing protein n=1 Tax=Clostridium sp. SHJSY1 TaxID=2942483 RepID=UPI00287578AC|nr:carboxypeptidase-like regulatory domain-containing protein [Clostridium sp. SHJSY1]MDS0527995.1 carboxypeptidase-like regulatory domain-containing protein [Clostridium sp. SHJSY1]